MGGGAWPFLVGGVICLVNSDNERDLNLLNSDRDTLGWSGTDCVVVAPSGTAAARHRSSARPWPTS